MIADDLEVMGPVRVKDVEAAQQRIVNTIRQLEEAGEIIVSRGKGRCDCLGLTNKWFLSRSRTLPIQI
jgi:hypothetical protein